MSRRSRALDARVDVLDPPVEPLAERARHRGLAGAHEADQVDLVGLHARSRSSVVEEPGIGDRDRVGAVDDASGPSAPSAAMANAIASR